MKITEIKRRRQEEENMPKAAEPSEREEENEESEPMYVQWGLSAGGVYTPAPKMRFQKNLKPGYYFPYSDMTGLHLQSVDVVLDGLVDFGKGASEQIVDEIDDFWKSEPKFRKINQKVKALYKRGIFLYGPPGCGKSSLISIVMKDIIERDGVAIEFTDYETVTAMIQIIRQIQPKTKILVIMEDLDTLIRRSETGILKMLDGVDTTFDSVIFLATSNYMEKIPARILRPSRFDTKIKLNFPDEDLRKRYLEDLMKALPSTPKKFSLAQATADTEGFSFADLKELFISACVFERPYQPSLDALKESLGLLRQNQERIDQVGKLQSAMQMLAVKMAE